MISGFPALSRLGGAGRSFEGGVYSLSSFKDKEMLSSFRGVEEKIVGDEVISAFGGDDEISSFVGDEEVFSKMFDEEISMLSEHFPALSRRGGAGRDFGRGITTFTGASISPTSFTVEE
jgi:hypothetical protein